MSNTEQVVPDVLWILSHSSGEPGGVISQDPNGDGGPPNCQFVRTTHPDIGSESDDGSAGDRVQRIVRVPGDAAAISAEEAQWLADPQAAGVRLLLDTLELQRIWEAFPPELTVLIAAAHADPTCSMPAAGFDGPVWAEIDRWDGPVEVRAAATTGSSKLRLPKLAPGPAGAVARALVPAIKPRCSQAMSASRTGQLGATCLEAGLLQIHDQLDASHSLSQSVEGESSDGTGDYWHAIMHRREPDYSNSGYWFRRVGTHPIFEDLANLAAQWLTESATTRPVVSPVENGRWDPMAMIELCRHAEQSGAADQIAAAEMLQWFEMRMLLEHSLRA